MHLGMFIDEFDLQRIRSRGNIKPYSTQQHRATAYRVE